MATDVAGPEVGDAGDYVTGHASAGCGCADDGQAVANRELAVADGDALATGSLRRGRL